MSDRDISDVTGNTYTYLMNGQTPASNWQALFARGESVRLRIINGAAMTLFDFRIPDLEMRVVAADGQNVEPVTVDELRIGTAETYDVIVEPRSDRAYTLFAQAIDRSGFARGTLTPNAGMAADIPAIDTAPTLSHVDMGMDMGMPMSVNGDQASAAAAHTMHSGSMQMSAEGARTAERHGAEVDMRAENPMPRLDDPGVGLRDRSWRVLSYSQLRHLGTHPDARAPDREIELHLTGNMSRYMWSFDGVRSSSALPIQLRLDERVRLTLVNDTMMNHPMHLHGMWSDLETGEDRLARKHTIIVQPGQKLSYQVTADAPGPWAYHCHLLNHMAAGMFRVVDVS